MGHLFDFVANSTDGVMAVDGAQRIVVWNPAASCLLGYAESEALGKPCYALMRGRERDGAVRCRKNCAAIEAGRRLEPPAWAEFEVTDKTGAPVWLSMSTIVVPSRGRRMAALVHVFRKVTRRHESLRVLEEFASLVGNLIGAPVPGPAHGATEPTIPVDLTRREREILALLTSGETTEAIADRLSISARTVRNHVSNVLVKLGVHSRLEAVTYSMRNGLL